MESLLPIKKKMSMAEKQNVRPQRNMFKKMSSKNENAKMNDG